MGRHDKIQTLTIRYLKQLTKADLDDLAAFAERRMDWLPPAQFSGEDTVHSALQAIQRGTWREWRLDKTSIFIVRCLRDFCCCGGGCDGKRLSSGVWGD